MQDTVIKQQQGEPITVDCQSESLDELLTKEWLHTNKLGAYASSTVVGCNTRRYHGILVAATVPPVGRKVTLSSLLEQLTIDGRHYDLSTYEFVGTFSPNGSQWVSQFKNDVAPTFEFKTPDTTLTKEILLAESANTVGIRYTLHGTAAKLRVTPLIALRDFHHLRTFSPNGQLTFQGSGNSVSVQDLAQPESVLHLSAGPGIFTANPDWWYQFHYRIEHLRGQDSREDLYTPGAFEYELNDGQSVVLTASLDQPTELDFPAVLQQRRERIQRLADSVGPEASTLERHLAVATDAFVVQRSRPGSAPSATILAGYPWFADWGRDTFIALPGLLLATQRFDLARQVFRTFASNISKGMIPNRFDDYGGAPHYNSIDASLWFIIAAERYMLATDDQDFWAEVLMPAINCILSEYRTGTRFDIHADADNLLAGGSHKTQLTWMDAALGDEVVTPRHGKAVETNAMWYCGHRIMAERCKGTNEQLHEQYSEQATLIANSFSKAFIIPDHDHLFDCIYDHQADSSIRPNQILAVSLPYSPLPQQKQQQVLRVVTEHLLTPLGLRTLSPMDPRYRRRYGGSWESRDRAYHQGTVWAWLIGPFIEAHLRVNQGKPLAVQQAAEWLKGFETHIAQAGLGQISEIFDGEPPHKPRGCFAQAWSVAEVLRARTMVREYQQELGV